MSETALELLADYLTGPDVGNHSMALAMAEGSLQAKAAKRFFALREAFGVWGYMSKRVAAENIAAKLTVAK